MANTDSSETPGVNLGLIITPMLDMSFQILAFFIMTYHPSALEGHVDGHLAPPKNVAGPAKGVLEFMPPGEPDLDDAITVTVNAVARGDVDHGRSDGQPSTISVQSAHEATGRVIATSEEPLETSWSRLAAELKKQRTVEGRGSVRLECQSDLKHHHVMRAFDVCKTAGYDAVAFVAPREQKIR